MKIRISSRKIISRLLIAVGILTLISTSLLLLTGKPIHEKTIDIVVILTGSIALVMAILTEAELEKHSKKFSKLHSDLSETLKELKEINADNEYLKRKLREEAKVGKEISQKLDKITESQDGKS